MDAIGTLEDAIINAALLVDPKNCMDNLQVVEYPKPVTTLDMLTSMITGEELMEVAEPLKSIYKAFSSWDDSQSGKVYARMPYTIDIN